MGNLKERNDFKGKSLSVPQSGGTVPLISGGGSSVSMKVRCSCPMTEGI